MFRVRFLLIFVLAAFSVFAISCEGIDTSGNKIDKEIGDSFETAENNDAEPEKEKEYPDNDDYAGYDWMGDDEVYPEGEGSDKGDGYEDSGDYGDTGDSGDYGNTGNTGDYDEDSDGEASPGDSDGGSDGGSGGDGTITQQPGQITAAEWRDLDNWDFWLELMEDDTYYGFVTDWGYYNFEKISVTVKNGDKPAVDAEVKLKEASDKVIWTAKTDNKGTVELFVYPFSPDKYTGELSIEVSYAGKKENIKSVKEGYDIEVKFSVDHQAPDVLDLMFMIDTTGSMGDELEYLKAELYDVIEKIHEDYGNNLTLRLSCNFYRDFGDDYVVRFFPFSTDIDEVLESLERQTAGGGGDRPEAVHMALENGINMHEWSSEAKARLMFLVLDAPPHINKQGVPQSIIDSVKDAAKKGIRIVPVAASGVDKSDEFFLRSIDIYTGGTYIFITDDSGIGNSHIEPTVGQHEVKYLNDLIVEIISNFLK